MAHYSFKLQVSGFDTQQSPYEDLLYEEGCGDALIAVIDGKMFLDFDREALSYDDAVKSAISDVQKPGGKVVGIEALGEQANSTKSPGSPIRGK